MTHEQIATVIAGIGLPYAYSHFEPGEVPDLPYICFIYPGRADFHADGVNYAKITNLNIELYTNEPDFDLEARVEAALDAAGLVYDITDATYIDSEQMYETLYQTSVLLDRSVAET